MKLKDPQRELLEKTREEFKRVISKLTPQELRLYRTPSYWIKRDSLNTELEKLVFSITYFKKKLGYVEIPKQNDGVKRNYSANDLKRLREERERRKNKRR